MNSKEEPMKTLHAHELQYCLEVIKDRETWASRAGRFRQEKLKMMFEGNASVVPTAPG